MRDILPPPPLSDDRYDDSCPHNVHSLLREQKKTSFSLL